MVCQEKARTVFMEDELKDEALGAAGFLRGAEALTPAQPHQPCTSAGKGGAWLRRGSPPVTILP